MLVFSPFEWKRKLTLLIFAGACLAGERFQIDMPDINVKGNTNKLKKNPIASLTQQIITCNPCFSI